MTLSFLVVGTPRPKGSTRAFVVGQKGPSGAILNPRAVVVPHRNTELKQWEGGVKAGADRALQEWIRDGEGFRTGTTSWPFLHAFGAMLQFVLPRPASVSHKSRPYPTVAPDVDKLARAVIDAMTGSVWKDDAQLIELRVTKTYGPTTSPGELIVTVHTIGPL